MGSGLATLENPLQADLGLQRAKAIHVRIRPKGVYTRAGPDPLSFHQAIITLAARNEHILVAGPRIVRARLTPAANGHELAVALPEQVVRARPTGVGCADAINFLKPIERADTGLPAAGT
jgi:hypothetical protein